jgi:hypothetical protein
VLGGDPGDNRGDELALRAAVAVRLGRGLDLCRLGLGGLGGRFGLGFSRNRCFALGARCGGGFLGRFRGCGLRDLFRRRRVSVCVW